MDANDRIREMVESNPVIIFMKGTPDFPQCGFSMRAVQALNACGVPYGHVNIFEDESIYKALPTYSNWPTFPQVFVNGELIGGCDITLELYQNGELQKMVTEAVGAAPEA